MEKRKKIIRRALDAIVENFKIIEDNSSSSVERFGLIKNLEKGNQVQYLLSLDGFKGIYSEYKDKKGNLIDIKINYQQCKK